MPLGTLLRLADPLPTYTGSILTLNGKPQNLVDGVMFAIDNGWNADVAAVDDFFDKISGLDNDLAARIVGMVDSRFINRSSGLATEVFVIGSHPAKLTSDGVVMATESGTPVFDMTSSGSNRMFGGAVPGQMFGGLPGLTVLSVLKPTAPATTTGGYLAVRVPDTSNLNFLVCRTRSTASEQWFLDGYRTVTGNSQSRYNAFGGTVSAGTWQLAKNEINFGAGTASIEVDGSEVASTTFTSTGTAAVGVVEGKVVNLYVGGDMDGPNFEGRCAGQYLISGNPSPEELDEFIEHLIVPLNPQYTPPS